MTRLPLETFLQRAGERPIALARLAGVFANMERHAEARELACKALKAAPQDPEVRSLASGLLGAGVPAWHFSIVRDAARNAAYEAALQRAVRPDSHVLEIGTGTGILAMMAARAGAARVTTCEAMPAVAEAAREIVSLNGFDDRVGVIAKRSTELDPADDMGGRADMLVSEIVSNNLLGQNILPVVAHAVQALLKPGARIIPARGIVRVALANDPRIDRRRMDVIDGFDLSPFNRLADLCYPQKRGDPELRLLSAPADLFDFDFQGGGPFAPGTAKTVLTSAGGPVNAIAQWIALRMDETGWYENDPRPGATSAWSVMMWPLATARDIAAGERVTVSGSHDCRTLRLWA